MHVCLVLAASFTVADPESTEVLKNTVLKAKGHLRLQASMQLQTVQLLEAWE